VLLENGNNTVAVLFLFNAAEIKKAVNTLGAKVHKFTYFTSGLAVQRHARPFTTAKTSICVLELFKCPGYSWQ